MSYTLDEIFKKPKRAYSMDEIFKQKKTYSLDAILGRPQKTPGEKSVETKEDDRDQWSLEDFLGEFAKGVGKEASLGIYDPGAPIDTTAGELGRGMGSFGGFLTTPLKIGKLGGKAATKLVTKALWKTAGKEVVPRAAGKVGSIATRLATRIAPQAATLGVAEAVSDITDPAGMPERFAHGAKIGTIFGAAGLSHVFQNKFYNQLLSQFGGRALLSVTGEWSPDVFNKEDLAQAVFAEALNTYFLSHGTSAKDVITGKAPYHVKKQLGILESQERTEAKRVGVMDKLRLRTEHFAKPDKIKVNIWKDIIVDTEKVSKHGVDMQKGAIRAQGKEGMRGMTAEYDPMSEKWVPKGEHETIMALRELSSERSNLQSYDPVSAEKLPDYNNITINGIGKPLEKPKRLIGVMRAAEILAFGKKNKDALTSALVQKAEETTRWAWDVEKKRLRPVNPTQRPFKNEVMFKQAEADGKYINQHNIDDIGMNAREILKVKETPTRFVFDKQTGKAREIPGKMTFNEKAQKELNKALAQIKLVKDAPWKAIPPAVKAQLGVRLKELRFGVDNPDQFLYMALGTTHPRLRDMAKIEEVMGRLEQAHPGARLKMLLNRFKAENDLFEYKDTEMFTDKWLQLKQAADDEYFHYRNWEDNKKYQSDLKNGKTTGTLLSNQLSLGWWKGWKNIEKVMHDWEMRTGIPFWSISRKMHLARRTVDAQVIEKMTPLEPFKNMTMKEQYEVYEYYDTMYRGKDIKEVMESMSPTAREFSKRVDKLMDDMKGHVAYYRMKNFISVNYESKHGGFMMKPKAEWKKIFKYQNEPLVKEQIDVALEVWKKLGEKGLQDYMMNGEGRELGTLQTGVYLPGLVLGKKPGRPGESFLSRGEYETHIDFQGRTHIKSRGTIGQKEKYELSDAHKDLGVQNLPERVNSYMRQVLNLTHMEPHLKSLDSLITMFHSDLQLIRGSGKFNFMDSIRLYAHRKKGFPVHQGAIGHALKKTQSVFFRTLTASNPYLWLRNLYQPYGTHPHKEYMLDPRYMAKRFKDIPEQYKKKFELENSQMGAVEHHYFFSDMLSQLEGKPLKGLFYRLAKPVGKIYAKTDHINRKSVYNKTWWRSRDYFKAYKEGKIDIDTMEKRVGMDKLDPLHRKKVRNFLDEGMIEDAAHHMSSWYVYNSQWIYERSEKSLHEMTAEGEAWTNLLTWTKSINQSMNDAYLRVKEGVDRGNDKMIKAGGSWIVGTLLAGQVGNQLLRHASGKHGAKHSDYGIDMFFWEMGGVSGSIAKDLTSAISDVAASMDEPPETREAALTNLVKMVDNVGLRQLVPFMKNALSVAETVTGQSHIEPVYNILSKRGMKKVDRTLVEGVVHAALASDPTKSAVVRSWTKKQEIYFHHLYMKEENPAKKMFYEYRWKRYEWLSDIFRRYTPYEVFSFYEERQRQTWMEQYEKNRMFDERAREEQRRDREQAKRDMGYR